MPTLYVREEGEYREAAPKEVFTRAQGLIAQRVRAGCPVFERPQDVREFLRIRLSPLEHEVFAVLFLDNRRRLIEYLELFRGTVNYAQVHTREIIKEALARNAAELVIAHNHPSGDPQPSPSDELMTSKLREALSMIDVRLVDHLIVGDSIFSFAECGRL